MEASSDNEIGVETENSALNLLAEGLVLLLSLLRIFVVALVLAVNIIALRRCSSKAAKCHCLYLYVSDSVKICSVIYITSWIPFLLYSMLNGRWLSVDQQIFCLIQNYMTNAVLLVLLALAALISLSKGPKTKRTSPKLAAGLTLAAWIIPQFVYFIILTSLDNASKHNDQDFYLLDDLLGANEKTTTTHGITYTIGFTICGHSLCQMGMSQYTLQYVVIILPICIASGLIYIRNQSRYPVPQPSYLEELTRDKAISANGYVTCTCNRGNSNALEVILGCIFFWLLLIRPMIVFIWSPAHLFDLGSHILLSITAVFAPILPQQKMSRKVSVFRIDPASIGYKITGKEKYQLKNGA